MDMERLLALVENLDHIEKLPRRIEICRLALRRVNFRTDPEKWIYFKTELGNSLARCRAGDAARNLEGAIRTLRQVVKITTKNKDVQDWAMLQNNLGAAYLDRVRGQSVYNVERAIEYLNRAFVIFEERPNTPELAMACYNLGRAYVLRTRGSRKENIQRATLLLQDAQCVYRTLYGNYDWEVENLLGQAFSKQPDGVRAENLEKAIFHYDRAINACDRGQLAEDWASLQNNIGTAYIERVKGDMSDNLERAIAYLQMALSVYRPGKHALGWAEAHGHLGIAYLLRIDGDDENNLRCAIRHFKKSLRVYTEDAFPYDWAWIQNGLGDAHRLYFYRAWSLHLIRAIGHYERALSVLRRAPCRETRAIIYRNVAAAYCSQIWANKMDNVEKSIIYARRSLRDFAAAGSSAENIGRTFVVLGKAYATRRKSMFQRDALIAARIYSKALAIFRCHELDVDRQRTFQLLGDLFFSRRNWRKALRAYRGSVAAEKKLLSRAITERWRRARLIDTPRRHVYAAYCELKLGRMEEALLSQERGRTQLLNTSLMPSNSSRNTSVKPGELCTLSHNADRQINIALGLRSGTRRGLLADLSATETNSQRETSAGRARWPARINGGLTVGDILALAPPEGALVTPLVTTNGSAILVFPYGATRVSDDYLIWLDDRTDATVRNILVGSPGGFGSGGWLGEYLQLADTSDRWNARIEHATHLLWEAFLAPIHERLKQFGIRNKGAPLVLIPHSGLSLLPLHAAWRPLDGGRAYFLDDYTVSYCPSSYVRAIASRRARETSENARSLLAVVNPTVDLPFTEFEGESVAAAFEPIASKTLTGAAATLKAVAKHCSGRAYLHFACHGQHSWRDPLDSRLLLADAAPVTMTEVVDSLDLAACRLVTLSGCETGLVQARESCDEYIGLSASFLQAGAAAIISTLWPVSDLSTMLLMEQFYRFHFHGLAPAEALRSAQIWLRGVTAEKAGLADRWRRVLDMASDREFAKTAFRNMRYYKRHPDETPYASPYYWAGFTFFGA
jgi:CHAT domain-containing protein/tetratricopeptide (TPR) repeat protein